MRVKYFKRWEYMGILRENRDGEKRIEFGKFRENLMGLVERF